MTRIGYARASSIGQNVELQVAALTAAGCKIIRSEKASGMSTKGRTELRTVLDFIAAGDELVVRLRTALRGVAPGQTLVLYRPDPNGDEVIGSATIGAAS